LPASGWAMMAKVLRRRASSARESLDMIIPVGGGS
jgi:hypothetical protein